MSKNITQPGRLAYTLQELSAATGVSVPFLRLEIGRGRLKPTRVGRRVVVTAAEVARYLGQERV